jgi:hypothetical protein
MCDHCAMGSFALREHVVFFDVLGKFYVARKKRKSNACS